MVLGINVSNGVEYFPLIAFNLEEDNWFLGVAFSLYQTNMIIAKADVSKDHELILNKDLLYINHCSSMYKYSSSCQDKECVFSCKYLNLITKDRMCKSDGNLE